MSEPFHVLLHFPKLVSDRFAVTSPPDPLYNCIAWAALDSTRWWEPDEDGYWPEGIARDRTLQSFIDAYGTLGFTTCTDGALEAGFEKLAIYSDHDGPQHAARQLPDGTWTSKLGPWEDIAHASADALEGTLYGTVVQYLRRAVTAPAPTGG